MSHLFFLSYAHDDNRPGPDDDVGLIEKFYLDLREKLRRKTGLPENEIGFFDKEKIPLGAKWSLELSEAIQTSKTFVSVYSPTYFKKPFCGQEWTVFNLRQQAYAKAYGVEEPRLMIPVLWEKEVYVKRHMPDLVMKYQYNHGVFGDHYTLHGLALILSNKSFREAYYEVFLDKFSDKLIEADESHKKQMPRFETDKPLEQIEPAFPVITTAAAASPNVQHEDANPRYVKFVFVVGRQKEMQQARIRQRLEYYREKGAEWTPYLPDVKRQIDLLVKQIALDRDFSPDEIDLDGDLLNRLEEAKNNNQIVVIVVDSWSLKIQNYREWMNKFDGKSFLNCIVVILWINDDETATNRTELEKFVKAAFPSRRLKNAPDLLDCDGSVDKLEDKLGKTLCETKENIIYLAEIQNEISSDQSKTKPDISAV